MSVHEALPVFIIDNQFADLLGNPPECLCFGVGLRSLQPANRTFQSIDIIPMIIEIASLSTHLMVIHQSDRDRLSDHLLACFRIDNLAGLGCEL